MNWFVASFGTQGDVTLLQECARAALIIIYSIALVRIAGRRLSGKWTGADIIVSVILGSTLSRSVTGTAPLLGTMAAAAVIVALHWIITHVAALSPTFSTLIEGKPIVVAEDGKLIVRRARMRAVSQADLQENLREVGADSVTQTQRVVLEPSGRLTVRRK